MENTNNIFRGRKFVITGKLDFDTRGDYEYWIDMRGGILQKSITKTTDYLVTNYNFTHGCDNSEKLDKAKSMGIKIISEDDLRHNIANIVLKQDKIKILLND